MSARAVAVVLVVAAAACQPTFDDDPSRVTGPRVLAVRSEPAEAKPGEAIEIRALYTDGVTTAVRPLAFDFCTARPALAEPTAVASACIEGVSGARARIGLGAEARGTMPSEACRLFGPERPLGKPGEPAGRPADPDGTGGFYQPGIVSIPALDVRAESLFEIRVRCNPSGATQAAVAELERRYRANSNPALESLVVERAGAPTPAFVAEASEIAVAPNELITLRVTWPQCPTEEPCGGAERYVAYDPAARVVVARRESIRASWLASNGEIGAARNGRAEDDESRDLATTWRAPASTSTSTIWVVLRDSRGGTVWRTVVARVP